MSSSTPPRLPALAAGLLFLSGLCALAYQTTWLRELRLIFGGSTAASAAVLAVFMGGLGLGGLFWGRRVDRHANPMLLYAVLELGVAAAAAASPFLLTLARMLYIALGGTTALGFIVGSGLRLLLTALVLGLPAFLMGGTLPAVARAVQSEADGARQGMALLYGANTFGAVGGALLTTFFLLEVYGDRRSLWIAALVNALVVVMARNLARRLRAANAVPPPDAADTRTAQPTALGQASAPALFVLVAAGAVGFAFFLMELVWYRMLGPILGGTTYTFGLILAVALAGTALGGALYARVGARAAVSLRTFAATCLLEALCVIVPFALGDHVASLALLLRPLGVLGFAGLVSSWSAVAALVVLPAAIVSGYQFPVLIALLGRGRTAVGRHVGAAYAANTVGAILGSLAGGFGLLPLLTAPGAWQLVAALLVVLGATATALEIVRSRRFSGLMWPALLTALTAAALFAHGPTAAWRHSQIGTGLLRLTAQTPNELRKTYQDYRRATIWEAEGVESSIAIIASNGLAFVVNGKTDGNIRFDAGTQIMSGMLLAMLHPAPRRAMVIGLGTGSTAGWLGAVPEMDSVEAVELEGAVLEMARRCAVANHSVLDNPKVHITIGDAREVLLISDERYDLILSEPSNPYRAGIASLYTVDFYRAVSERLAEGGLFGQWLQAYSVDGDTVRTVYASLREVFESVETWQTETSDLLLIASHQRKPLPLDRLRRGLDQEPFRTALKNVWRVSDLEGVLAYRVGPPELADAVAQEPGVVLNTDDHNVLEFGFARTLGRSGLFSIGRLRGLSRAAFGVGLDGAGLNHRRIENEASYIDLIFGGVTNLPADATLAQRRRHQAMGHYAWGQLERARELWERRPREPEGLLELSMVAEVLADAGASEALTHIEALAAWQPTEAHVLRARLAWRQRRPSDAADELVEGFSHYRSDPWPLPLTMTRGLRLLEEVSRHHPELAPRLWDVLEAPFALHMLDEARMQTRLRLAGLPALEGSCASAFAAYEPYPSWQLGLLLQRVRCYQRSGHALLARAEADLARFLEVEPAPFSLGLPGLDDALAPVDLRGSRRASGIEAETTTEPAPDLSRSALPDSVLEDQGAPGPTP